MTKITILLLSIFAFAQSHFVSRRLLSLSGIRDEQLITELISEVDDLISDLNLPNVDKNDIKKRYTEFTRSAYECIKLYDRQYASDTCLENFYAFTQDLADV